MNQSKSNSRVLQSDSQKQSLASQGGGPTSLASKSSGRVSQQKRVNLQNMKKEGTPMINSLDSKSYLSKPPSYLISQASHQQSHMN